MKKAIRKGDWKRKKKKKEENSRNEDGEFGEFDQGFEGKCTTMSVRKTSVLYQVLNFLLVHRNGLLAFLLR